MSMIQKIEIDGKQVPFKASAAIPRIYRIKFHRDIQRPGCTWQGCRQR